MCTKVFLPLLAILCSCDLAGAAQWSSLQSAAPIARIWEEEGTRSAINRVISKAIVDLRMAETYGSFTDPGVWLLVLVFNLFNAQINDTFPTTNFRLTPSNDRYKLRSCPRKDLAKCLCYGNSSNGLPKPLQGIWWQEGVLLPEQAISTGQAWDPVQRKLTLKTYANRVWAWHNTGSEKGPFGNFYLPSGAAEFNAIASTTPSVEAYFNEDITKGQLILVVPILGFDLRFPPAIVNWTMYREPDGSWFRDSSFFGINSSVGLYTLRQAINGEGKPGPYWEQWLKDQDGQPFLYAETLP